MNKDLLPLALTVAQFSTVPVENVTRAVKSFNSNVRLRHSHANDLKALEYLSAKARENLKILLQNDFKVLEILAENGLSSSVSDLAAECAKVGKRTLTSEAQQKEDWLEFIKYNYSTYRYNLIQMLSNESKS